MAYPARYQAIRIWHHISIEIWNSTKKTKLPTRVLMFNSKVNIWHTPMQTKLIKLNLVGAQVTWRGGVFLLHTKFGSGKSAQPFYFCLFSSYFGEQKCANIFILYFEIFFGKTAAQRVKEISQRSETLPLLLNVTNIISVFLMCKTYKWFYVCSNL